MGNGLPRLRCGAGLVQVLRNQPKPGVFFILPFVHGGFWGWAGLSGVFESALGWWSVVGWGKNGAKAEPKDRQQTGLDAPPFRAL